MIDAMEESNRCLGCIKKPCMNGCPLNNNIPDVIKLFKESKIEEAYYLLLETNPLGSLCGRICPTLNQCMKNCTKGKIDEPIRINEIEKYINDLAIEKSFPINKAKSNGKKVAVVGSGPSGLSCAFYLARSGFEVTIFEKHSSLGGLLVRGIPDFRLSTSIVNKVVDRIISLGINVELNKELGKDILIDELVEKYDAVYLGFGANVSNDFGIPGENLEGVYGANELLEYKEYPSFVDRRVAIIGGGNVAMDAARTINKLGAKEVTIIYRRSEAEMPSLESERIEAIKEGIKIMYLTNVVKVCGDSIVKSVELIKTNLVDVGLDRLVPENILGSNFCLDVDYVIKALGSKPDNLVNNLGLKLNEKKYLYVDNYQTSNNKVFAGGDLIGTKSTVAFATRDGREAAKKIIEFLK